jgi:hypothetical protein
VCWELTFSIDPFELFKTIRGIKHQEDKLCSLFCFSAWMAPVIPDYADIGAYSMATKAQIYRKAAERMPKLILEASFGDPATLRTMQSFMEQWESAEETLTTDDTKLLRDLSKKDRGPFLFWLITECWLEICNRLLRRFSIAGCLLYSCFSGILHASTNTASCMHHRVAGYNHHSFGCKCCSAARVCCDLHEKPALGEDTSVNGPAQLARCGR